MADRERKPRCLVVRPKQTSDHAGDEIVYRRSLAYLARFYDYDLVEVEPVGKFAKLLNILRPAPPEVAAWLSAANDRRVAAAAAARDYHAVLFFCETTFPTRKGVRTGRRVLVAHNVHSVIARTEPTPLARLLLPLAVAFERRWYGDPTSRLVCISVTDVEGLKLAGVTRDDILVAPPGAPPAAELGPLLPVEPLIVLTGSYGWWRKRRDLKAFLKSAPRHLPIHTTDPEAAQIVSASAVPLDSAPRDWSRALRFGLVTDRFSGGFKLKSTEYIARNCMVLSCCDLSREFEGLPHAEEFVRHVRTGDDVTAIVTRMSAEDPAALHDRFATFRQACLARYDWDHCLAGLREAIESDPLGEVQ